jgi:hypothetical protein
LGAFELTFSLNKAVRSYGAESGMPLRAIASIFTVEALDTSRKDRRIMTQWEYAMLLWQGPGMGKHRTLEFSNRDNLDKLSGGVGGYDAILRSLGDDGWEMYAVELLPKGGSLSYFKQPRG